MMTTPPTPEFSRPLAVESLENDGATLSVEANAEERARLAERFGLIGIDSLKAEVWVAPEPGGELFRMDGAFTADVTQTCVVTLEALPAHVEDSFVRLYSTAADADDPVDEHLDLDAEDPPDPVEGGHIDVGEAIAEQLALSLDPFPRKPGISFTDYSPDPTGGSADSVAGAAESGAADGPFAALARLKDRLK